MSSAENVVVSDSHPWGQHGTVSMDKDVTYWNRLHSIDRTPWHIEEIHPKLVQYLPMLQSNVQDGPLTILLPLCGRSLDLLHLYKQGHTVIGCEAVEKPCKIFFEEHNLEYERKETDNGPVFQTPDGRLRLYCCNFFDLTPEMIGGKVNCVWDRASLVAVDWDLRQKYASVLKRLVADQFSMLMWTVEFDAGTRGDGPPFSYPLQEIKELFDDFCSVRVLDNRIPDWNNYDANYFLMTRKRPVEIAEQDSAANGLTEPAAKKTDRIDYWQGRWVDGKSQWHSKDINKHLQLYLEKLKGDKTSMRIFFPLCGKSLDLAWLWKQGHDVVGLEGVAYVAESLFKDAGIEYTKEYVAEIDGFRFKSSDGRLVVYACDLFNMTPEVLGGRFDAVYDRGSFEAIYVEDRPQYVDLMFKIVDPDHFNIVLNGYVYDGSKFGGPPRVVEKETVFKLYGSRANVTILEETDTPERAKNFGLENMTKVIYHITNN